MYLNRILSAGRQAKRLSHGQPSSLVRQRSCFIASSSKKSLGTFSSSRGAPTAHIKSPVAPFSAYVLKNPNGDGDQAGLDFNTLTNVAIREHYLSDSLESLVAMKRMETFVPGWDQSDNPLAQRLLKAARKHAQHPFRPSMVSSSSNKRSSFNHKLSTCFDMCTKLSKFLISSH